MGLETPNAGPIPYDVFIGRGWVEPFIYEGEDFSDVTAIGLGLTRKGKASVQYDLTLADGDISLLYLPPDGQEAIGTEPPNALLVKTKTDVNSLRYLPDHLVERIRDLGPRAGQRVFRYRCRFSVNERIKAVCARAGLPYKSSHTVGRHAFATNALNAGVSVRVAMDAGGWKSSAIFLETYAHTIDAGRTVRDRFNAIHHQDQF